MNTKPLFLILPLFIASLNLAVAEELKCGCNTNFEDNISSADIKGYTLSCEDKDAFTDNTEKVSVQETNVKVYVEHSQQVHSSGNSMDIVFRSRNGHNLTSVADGVTDSVLWAGSVNDTNDKTVDGFHITAIDPATVKNKTMKMWNALYRAHSKDDYDGAVIFAELPTVPGKKSMIALCLQNR